MRGREPVFGTVACINTAYAYILAAAEVLRREPGFWGWTVVVAFGVTTVAACRSIYLDRIK